MRISANFCWIIPVVGLITCPLVFGEQGTACVGAVKNAAESSRDAAAIRTAAREATSDERDACGREVRRQLKKISADLNEQEANLLDPASLVEKQKLIKSAQPLDCSKPGNASDRATYLKTCPKEPEAQKECEKRYARALDACSALADSEKARDVIPRLEGVKSALIDAAVRLDPHELQLNLYGATVFSNLYRETPDDGMFSKSKFFLQLEARQQLVDPSRFGSMAPGVISFLEINLQTTATQENDQGNDTGTSSDFVTKSGQFTGELGLEAPLPWEAWSPNLSVRPFASLGAGSFAKKETEVAGSKTQDVDQFGRTTKAGLRFYQSRGTWEGSLTEIAYFHDPTFIRVDRTLVRARLVISPELQSNQRGLGAFIEGSVNMARGRDEARIVLGLRLDTLSVLRAIVGVAAN